MRLLPGLGGQAAPFSSGVAPPVTVFPVVEATNQNGSLNTLNTSFAAALPASIQAGELLLLLLFVQSASATLTISQPSGWSTLYNIAGTANEKYCCFYKTATGSEGASVTVSGTTGSVFTSNSYRISGWQGTPEGATTARTTNANPNPPNLSPSWGAAKTLWIAAEGDISTSPTAPTSPANFTDGLTVQDEFSMSVVTRMSSARRELEVSSLDPGTFTIGSSAAWLASTVAIRPA